MSIAAFSVNYAFGAEVEVVHIPPPHHLLNYDMKGVQSDIVRNDDRAADFKETVFNGDFQFI